MAKWVVLGFVLLLFAGLGYGAYKAYPYYRLFQLRDASAVTASSKKSSIFYVPSKANLAKVADLLTDKGLIRSREDFVFFAKAKNYQRRRIVPGKYRLRRDMTYNQLVNHLRAGRGRRAVKVSFHNVKHFKDLAARVGGTLEQPPAAFLRMLKTPASAERYNFSAKTFPIMFLPDTYRMDWACSPACFLKRMAKAYRQFWRGKNDRKARRLGLSRLQVATLASIVQAEQSKKLDEWPRIAGLYLNRLKRNMKLEADPTVKFALGKPGLRRVLFKHLKVDSPYNTYRYKGLPPSPIRWPEKRAILAVLNYERHNYIFMCAKPEYSGYHNFARTRRGHQRNARLYHRWLRKEGIR